MWRTSSRPLREHEPRTSIDQFRIALGRGNGMLAIVDVAGDGDALNLSEELDGDTALYNEDDLMEHFAGDDLGGMSCRREPRRPAGGGPVCCSRR